MTPPYSNDHTRLLDRLAHDAAAHGAKAQKWIDDLASREVEATTAEDAFVADPTPENALTLAEAKHRLADFGHAAEAVTNAGGPGEFRSRALRTPAVYAAFAKGFAERIQILTRAVPGALKRLGERRALLTEQGTPSGIIETDATVCGLRVYHDALVRNIATATFGEVYASKRGQGYAARSFDLLYSDLTQSLPQAPAA